MISGPGRIVILLVSFSTIAAVADAGPLILLGGHGGTPLRLAGSAGILFPIGVQPQADVQPSVTHRGMIVEAAVGSGGQRLGVGLAAHLAEARYLNYGLDLVATVTRTAGRPRVASPSAGYAGVSAGLTLSLIRVTAGFERRLSDSDTGKRSIFTWTAGLQVPLHR